MEIRRFFLNTLLTFRPSPKQIRRDYRHFLSFIIVRGLSPKNFNRHLIIINSKPKHLTQVFYHISHPIRSPHPHLPPHFAKCGGNYPSAIPSLFAPPSLANEVTFPPQNRIQDQRKKNQTSPRFPSLLTPGGQSPLPLPSPLALRLYHHTTLQYLPQNQPF